MKTDTLEQLYIKKYKWIRNYLIKMGASVQDAEDITQSTFYKAITYDVYANMENPTAWLFKVAVNDYFNLCKRNKKHTHIQVEDSFFEKFLSHEDGELVMIQKERAKEIRSAIDSLKPSYANLLLLKYEMDLSYEQIATMLDTKPETVKTNLYRARNEFKKKWSELYGLQ
ncbi:MAG: RNA polymerase sigma factor [Bacillaceae bacterium]